MGFRSFFKKALQGAISELPIIGPVIGGMIPGDKDDKIISAVGDRLSQIEGLVMMGDHFGEVWKDKTITGEDKAKALAPQIAAGYIQSMQIAGKKLSKDKEALLLQKSQTLGGIVADIMECFEQK